MRMGDMKNEERGNKLWADGVESIVPTSSKVAGTRCGAD